MPIIGTTEWLIIWFLPWLLEGVCWLHIISYIWLMTRYSESIPYISQEVPLAYFINSACVSCIVPELSTTKCACTHLRSRDIWALIRFLALASGMEFHSISRCSCRSSLHVSDSHSVHHQDHPDLDPASKQPA